MKLSGIAGTGKGKVGSMVFATCKGEQVVRQYQPNVANPNTTAQTNSRAKLKLMSQLAAALSDSIAIPSEGMKSSRNLFIKKNYGLAFANGGVAQVSYENVQLTSGKGGIAAITASRDANQKVTISLQDAAAPSISRVVYICYKKTDDAELQLVTSVINETPGDDRHFEAEFDATSGELVFFAYGMKDADAAATAKFGDMQVESASDLAQLVVNRSITSSEFRFTGTRGATMNASGSIIEPVPAGKARVYLTASGLGTVNGAGLYDIGSQVTVTATAGGGATFEGWYKQAGGQQTLISNSSQYTFTLNGTTDLVAVFQSGGGSFDPGSD